MITKSDCLNLGKQDSIAHLRRQFALPPDVICLDGNSSGPQPVSALSRAANHSTGMGQGFNSQLESGGLV